MGFNDSEHLQYDSKIIKDWLIDYRERWRDIETQDEMLKRLNERMVSTSAKEMNGMPHSGDPSSDKLAMMIAQKDKVSDRIKALIDKQNKQREQIDAVIQKLRSSDERAVISLRYLTDMSWNDVSKSMFGFRDDFEDREESYLRRITKAHGRALGHMADVMNTINIQKNPGE